MNFSVLRRAAGAGLALPLFLSAQSANFPPGFPPGGPGFGPPSREELKVRARFDRNADGHLDRAERAAAREYVQQDGVRPARRGPGGRGGFPGGGRGPGGGASEPSSPGINLQESDVTLYEKEPLYSPAVVRTFFLTFENADWEKELEAFRDTDVEVPAAVRVDGKDYREVGVHFRGQSSYMMVRPGSKRSLNLSFDDRHENQNLLGYRTVNLLNGNGDPTLLRGALYSHIAQHYIPTPKINFARVVINGENWGIYAAAEQFNKDFLKERFGSAKGARWKVPGSPGGRGGFAYLGDDPADYRRSYEIKSTDDPADWAKLIRVCRLLETTAPDQLEAALAPIFDVDGALRFLALDNALANSDGFWTRTSDYSIGEDAKGRLHLVPHDMNEAFDFGGGPGGGRGRPPGGPGGPGGRGGGGPRLDPLAALNNPNAALAARLLAVPELRARYLGYIRDIAEKWLDWKTIGPVLRQWHARLAADMQRDTRKLASFDAFVSGLEGENRSLKTFLDQRREFLLAYKES